MVTKKQIVKRSIYIAHKEAELNLPVPSQLTEFQIFDKIVECTIDTALNVIII